MGRDLYYGLKARLLDNEGERGEILDLWVVGTCELDFFAYGWLAHIFMEHDIRAL
jgi:hypothetical protein